MVFVTLRHDPVNKQNYMYPSHVQFVNHDPHAKLWYKHIWYYFLRVMKQFTVDSCLILPIEFYNWLKYFFGLEKQCNTRKINEIPYH